MKPILFLSIFLLTLDIYCQDIFQSLRVDERRRSMIIHLPRDYNPENQYPLVINMHGFLMNATQQKNYTQFNELADQEGVIVVYPEGINKRWNSGEFFGVKSKIDDVAFVGAIIDFMALKYKVDTKRVYATGYSAGGFMAYKLACSLSERIAAIAPVASSMTAENFHDCDPQFDVAILAMNGTGDFITAYNGFVSVTSTPKVMVFWSEELNCSPEPQVSFLPNSNTQDKSEIEKIDFEECNGATPVVFYKILKGGHTWPGAKSVPILGNTNQDVSANDEIWNFFKNKTVSLSAICESPNNLVAEVKADGSYLFFWDNEQADNDYDLVLYNDTGVQLVQNIEGGQAEVSVDLDNDFNWTIRSKCPSGYVEWVHGNKIVLSEKIAQTKKGLVIFPNPVQEKITVNTQNIKSGNWMVTISDVFGVIKIQKALIVKQDNVVSFHTGQLRRGGYILSLKNKDQVYSTSFYKE